MTKLLTIKEIEEGYWELWTKDTDLTHLDDDILKYFLQSILSILEGLKGEEMDIKDRFYGKGEIEAGFEHAYNKAIKELNDKLERISK